MKSVVLAFVCSSFFAAAKEAPNFAGLLKGPPSEQFVYANRGETKLVLHVFRPADAEEGELRPAIMFIHGGGWIGGTPDLFMSLARYFATRGMVGVNISYRLAKAGETTIADCITDCRSALRYLRVNSQQLGIDPERIAVAGDSAGGHLAAVLGTMSGFDASNEEAAVPGLADAMIIFNPIVDMTEGDWIRFAVGGPALWDRKNTPRPTDESSVAVARSLSPLFFVGPGQPPSLIVHGKGDRVVGISQAERFAEANRAAGNRCEYIPLGEDVGHAFALPAYKSEEKVVVENVHAVDRFLRSLDWIQGDPTLVVSNPPAWEIRRK
ncbi:MAG: alpha/beta hydrolase [Terrimicrobiaceae bacterium]|nr:alpha/beta hydrolase [Terrimicrobiaceae bacterium]